MWQMKQVEAIVFDDPVDRILYAKPLNDWVGEFIETSDILLGVSTIFHINVNNIDLPVWSKSDEE